MLDFQNEEELKSAKFWCPFYFLFLVDERLLQHGVVAGLTRAGGLGGLYQ